MDSKSVGQFISALRKSKGMTQQELAQKLNVTSKAISKWECGDGFPEITIIPVLAEIFEVTTDEILQGRRIQNIKSDGEKVDAKTELQIKRIVNSTINKFKNLSLIAIALVIIGLISLVSFSYASHTEVALIIGFSIFITLLVGSTILEVILINNTNSAIRVSGIIEDEKEILAPFYKTIYNYALVVFTLIAISAIFTVPFFIATYNFYITHFVYSDDYTKWIPLMIIISIFAFYAVKLILKKVFNSIFNYSEEGVTKEASKKLRIKFTALFVAVLSLTGICYYFTIATSDAYMNPYYLYILVVSLVVSIILWKSKLQFSTINMTKETTKKLKKLNMKFAVLFLTMILIIQAVASISMNIVDRPVVQQFASKVEFDKYVEEYKIYQYEYAKGAELADTPEQYENLKREGTNVLLRREDFSDISEINNDKLIVYHSSFSKMELFLPKYYIASMIVYPSILIVGTILYIIKRKRIVSNL